MASIRPAAVAGMFYPREPRGLAAEVQALLARAHDVSPRVGFPKALVVPHAGYIYSGAIAARAYSELAGARGLVRRVVLLGPVHRVAGRGLAAPPAHAFQTPLGTIPLDFAALQALHGLPQVVKSDPAHALEHSLEVQLPFLQTLLGEFTLVPLAGGRARARHRPRRGLRRDAAERAAVVRKEAQHPGTAARRMQFRRHRRRQGPRRGLLLLRLRRGLGGRCRRDAGEYRARSH